MNFNDFRNEKSQRNWNNEEIRAKFSEWHNFSISVDYQYMFDCCGLPIIQDPQDFVYVHELIWKLKPNLIIETGVARGGSLMLSASSLAMLSYLDILKTGVAEKRKVIGVDIDIRKHNYDAIKSHPLSPLIELVQGSSIDKEVLDRITLLASEIGSGPVLILLDSNHTEEHVFIELMEYSKFVPKNSAILVLDTGIEFAPKESFNVERPWNKGDNPYTAVKRFMKTEIGQTFKIDQSMEMRHLITCATEGLLIKVR